VALIGGALISERPTGRQITGAALVIVGAAMFFLGDLGASVVGMIAALISLGANAASALLGRSVNRSGNVDATTVTTVSMALGAVALLAVSVPIEGWPAVSARAWVIIIWLALVNTAWAFTLWNLSLRKLSALESAAINNTMLIQIAILAWVFLDESLGAGELVGIVLVSIGIVMTQRVLALRSPG
jgi:drug/metabolite transporter (DMT)-like permease